ncbi:MAG: hypothetical protein PHS02_03620, partial [Candidatus ainarchaeum sp.]|nr:hypothetical protein [Candidatus ainarchaeum sp.]
MVNEDWDTIWERRLETSKWADNPSKELFLKFAKDASLHQITGRRIEKYRSVFSILHKLTKKSLIEMLNDAEGVVAAVNASKNLSPETKKSCKNILGIM